MIDIDDLPDNDPDLLENTALPKPVIARLRKSFFRRLFRFRWNGRHRDVASTKLWQKDRRSHQGRASAHRRKFGLLGFVNWTRQAEPRAS